MAGLQTLPNPNTPLAFLPPTLANQLEVAHFFVAGTCGMFVWDILINIRNDYKLLTNYRIAFPTIVYFLSRIASFGCILTTILFIGPVRNCQTLKFAIGGCFAAAVSLTSLLIFFRVRAIFYNNMWIIGFFSVLWLGTVAGSATVPFAIEGSHIGSTDYCISTVVKPYSSAGIIIVAINDTIVFFSISWKLLSSSSINESLKTKVDTFIRGNGLPLITRSLLQSGQEYYLITVTSNILTMVMILVPSLPAVFHALLTVPNVAITNSMACRVYRDIKFGRISSTRPIIPLHSSTLTSPPSKPPAACISSKRTQCDPYQVDLESNQDMGASRYGIHFSKSVHQSQDPPMIIGNPYSSLDSFN